MQEPLETQVIAELSKLIELLTERDIVLDLKDVGVIDREVMRFFLRCVARGTTIQNDVGLWQLTQPTI